MLRSAVSVLVVAQSSSEVPEGLMNNPVFIYVYAQQYSTIVRNYNLYLVRGDMFRLLMQPSSGQLKIELEP